MKQRNRRIHFCITILALGIILSPVFAVTSQAASSYNNMRVASGDDHALMIDTEGNVWAFGDNSKGQLGDGTLLSKEAPVMIYSKVPQGKAVSVAAGSSQSLILLEDGTVLMCGYGSPEQVMPFEDKAQAIAAGGDICMAILQSGAAVCWEGMSGTLPVKNEGGTVMQNIKEIAVGSSSFIILTDTSDYAYQLSHHSGDNFWTAAKVSIAAPPSSSVSSSSAAASSSAASSSASASTSGGAGTEKLKGVISISAGRNFGVALLNTGKVYTWGTNTASGVLGQGSFAVDGEKQAASIGLSSIVKISAGMDHAIAIQNSAGVVGWGNATAQRLDASLTDSGYCSPVSLNFGGIGISQLDCGNTWNILLATSGEFYTWGNNKPIAKLVLVQTLLKTPTPVVAASLVGDQMMTITWNPAEFHTEFAAGFMVSYTMPDGSSGKTQLLPLTSTQITLRGLQPATNYQITLSILGKTGVLEATPSFIVQTAKDDGLSSAVASAVVSSGNAGSPSVSGNDGASGTSSDAGTSGNGLYSTFKFIMIVLIILSLAFAVIAFVFIWKRMDKNRMQKIKPVRVSPDEIAEGSLEETAAGSDAEDDDMKVVPDKDIPQDVIMPAEQVVWDTAVEEGIENSEAPETTEPIETEEPEETENVLPEDYLPKKDPVEETPGDDGFLTRLPSPHGYNADEDDFIIRRPGEPKS